MNDEGWKKKLKKAKKKFSKKNNDDLDFEIDGELQYIE